MKVYSLRKEQVIPKPIEEVFAFFNRPENLETITPESLHFKILTPKPILMQQGALIDYVIEILGIPQRWTSYIDLYQPPHRFVDTQIRGPYSFWHHTHTFESTNQGTLVRDEVLYALPGIWIGRLVNHFFVQNQLRDIYEHRAAVIAKVFGGA